MPRADGLRGGFIYNSEIFSPTVIEGWANDFSTLITQVLSETTWPIGMWLTDQSPRPVTMPPSITTPSTDSYSAARTPLEQTLLTLWQELLPISSVDIHDDFFALGGHSLLATQLVARLRQDHHVQLPLKVLYSQATVAAVAAYIEQHGQTAATSAEINLPSYPKPTAPIPLSFAQERLWVLEQLGLAASAYIIPYALALHGELDEAVLTQSIQAIVLRHESLRTTFPSIDDQPVQHIEPAIEFELPVENLVGLSAETATAKQQQIVAQETATPFDLATGPLFRARLLKHAPNQHSLLLTFHHIIVDGWSASLFAQELTDNYAALLANHAPKRPPLTAQYQDFARWERAQAASTQLANARAYRQQKDQRERATAAANQCSQPARQRPKWRN